MKRTGRREEHTEKTDKKGKTRTNLFYTQSTSTVISGQGQTRKMERGRDLGDRDKAGKDIQTHKRLTTTTTKSLFSSLFSRERETASQPARDRHAGRAD